MSPRHDIYGRPAGHRRTSVYAHHCSLHCSQLKIVLLCMNVHADFVFFQPFCFPVRSLKDEQTGRQTRKTYNAAYQDGRIMTYGHAR